MGALGGACTRMLSGLWMGTAKVTLVGPMVGRHLRLAGHALRAPTLCVLSRLVCVLEQQQWLKHK